MTTVTFYAFLFASTVATACAGAATLGQLNGEMQHFRNSPIREHFARVQAEADQLASELKKKGNNADLLTAVFIMRAAEKGHWPITGTGAIAQTARELAARQSKLSSYVRDDRAVDLKKLDIWWVSYFATGDDRYLADLLSVARDPRPGEHAVDFMVPAMAAWSFKSNCRQSPDVRAYAKKVLATNSSPQKNTFLKECVGASAKPKSLGVGLVTAHETPTRMTRIVIRHLGQPAGFPSAPTVEYFAGTGYGRVEEALDSVNHIHGLGITNEPNVWMINLVDRSGRHMVDPGPTFNLHAPVFTTATAKGQPAVEKGLEGLEYGHEVPFFRQHHAKEGKREVEGKSYSTFSLKHGAVEVRLLVDTTTGRPFEIEESKDGTLVLAVRYLSYETGLPFQKALFEPPAGIRMTEAR